MPFEISPKIVVNPWVLDHPVEAKALADLAAHLRTPMVAAHWNFSEVWCGTAGCAVGHSPDVPSCYAMGLTNRHHETLNEAWRVFRLPGSPRRKGSNVAHDFFSSGSYEANNRDVTPVMVADRIDHWLATGEIR